LRAAGKYRSLKFINMAANKKSNVYTLEKIAITLEMRAYNTLSNEAQILSYVRSCLYVIGVYMCDPYLEIGIYQGF